MSNTTRKRISALLTYLALSIIFVFVIFPIFYTFMGSFKSNQELLTSGSTLIPQKFVLDNYKQAWSLANFERYTMNSVFMSTFIVLGTIITSTVAGYCFERGRFRGKNLIFSIVVSSMFVSLGSLTLYPTVMIAKWFGINKSLFYIGDKNNDIGSIDRDLSLLTHVS